MDYETAAPVDAPLPKVYVYDRDKDPRYQELCNLFRWFDGTQHDYTMADFQGRGRRPGCGYIADRHRDKGWVSATDLGRTCYDSRRPNAPAGLARRIISRFTELTLGIPLTLVCPSDADTTAYLAAVYEESNSHDALQEARDFAGATGSAVLIPSVTASRPNCEALPSFAVVVLEWADRKRWIPAVVVHQYRVEIAPKDCASLAPEVKTRTRMWTPEHYIEFEDAAADHAKDAPLVEKSRAEHCAGRCPVIWVQNTRSTRSPEGEYDLLNPANLELCDEVDRMQSHTLKSTKANTQPPLVRADDPLAFAQQYPRLAKGSGIEMRVSKGGTMTYLELDPDTLKAGWEAAKRLEEQVQKNVNCWLPESEQITSAPSGVAVAKMRRGMETRGNRLRTTLAWAVRQLCQIWISIGAGIGVTSEDDPQDGLILPPRVFPPEPVEPEEVEPPELGEDGLFEAAETEEPEEPEPTLGPHVVGKGRSVRVLWPAYDQASPTDLKEITTGLTTATADKILSRKTATERLVSAMGLRDPEEEHRRIAEEAKAGELKLGPLLGAPASGAEKAAEDGALAGAEDQEPEVEDDAGAPGAA
jgi:hypothetical protein